MPRRGVNLIYQKCPVNIFLPFLSSRFNSQLLTQHPPSSSLLRHLQDRGKLLERGLVVNKKNQPTKISIEFFSNRLLCRANRYRCI